MAQEPLILYSTNSELAYKIAEKYYDGKHYVWCTPCFSSSDRCFVPPSSEPLRVAARLYEDIKGRDRHSAKIESLRINIKRGATAKWEAGVITAEQLREISGLVDAAELVDFMPLLFVIPYKLVSEIARAVGGENKANFFSVEYLIESLPKDSFEALKIYDI
jgi:hypothetical protein